MDLQVTDERVLVTGSSAGIGRAIASTLAEQGASVAITGRDGRKAERVVVAPIAYPFSDYMNGANYRVDGGSTTAIN